jgi:hypothetical protein
MYYCLKLITIKLASTQKRACGYALLFMVPTNNGRKAPPLF